MLMKFRTCSPGVLRTLAEKMPRGIPISRIRTRAMTPSRVVTGILSCIRAATGMRYLIEVPKSPRRNPAIQFLYWTVSGRLVPSFSRRASTASSLAEVPRISLAGSPGIT